MSKLDHWATTDRDGEDAEYQKRRIDALWDEKMERVTPAELIAHIQKFMDLTPSETVDWICNFSLVDSFDKWHAGRQLDFLEGL